MRTLSLTIRQLATFQLIAVAACSLACAGGQKTNAELKELASSLRKDKDAPCLDAVKAAKARDGDRESFLRGKSSAFQSVLYAVRERCTRQVKELVEQGYPIGAVALMEEWKATYPISFPDRASRSGGFLSSRKTALAYWNKHKADADKHRAAYKERHAAYRAVDAKKYPALAYAKFLETLKVPARTPEHAKQLMEEHAQWQKRLESWTVLPFATRIDTKDPYGKLLFQKLLAYSKKNARLRYDTKRPYVILDVKLSKPTTEVKREQLTLRHRYAASSSSRKVKANPGASKELARLQEQYKRAKRSFERTKCSGGGVPGRDCARGEKQSLDRLRERLERAGGKVGKTRTKTTYRYATFEYPGTRITKKMSHKMDVKISWPGRKREPTTLKFHPFIRKSTVTNGEHWKYRITKKTDYYTPKFMNKLMTEFVSEKVLAADVLERVRTDYWVNFIKRLNPKWSDAAQANAYYVTFCLNYSLAKERTKWLGKLSEGAKAQLGGDAKCTLKHMLPVYVQHKNDLERQKRAKKGRR